jgi:hypothetical protein
VAEILMFSSLLKINELLIPCAIKPVINEIIENCLHRTNSRMARKLKHAVKYVRELFITWNLKGCDKVNLQNGNTAL